MAFLYCQTNYFRKSSEQSEKYRDEILLMASRTETMNLDSLIITFGELVENIIRCLHTRSLL